MQKLCERSQCKNLRVLIFEIGFVDKFSKGSSTLQMHCAAYDLGFLIHVSLITSAL